MNSGSLLKLLFLVFLLSVNGSAATEQVGSFPRYQTSSSCASCHHQQFDAWINSHHGWAWREPISENVLGNFNQVNFKHAGFTYHFLKENDEYYVVADNPSGKATQYKVHSVAGVTPLQQYLLDIGDGRLQALDVAWDTT
ncbi:MAG: cytochrome c family protein, partial [Candidatus Thiodiazotropha sp. (ex Notomyrtea botanica)]|nr:cytochrome c family protein [Candidatus Thiodiazotropha sp. (ex Notomyrtea botanica)]